MTLFKKNMILILLPLFAVSFSFAASTDNDFSGTWCWDKNSDVATFSLSITKSSNFYKGGYDSVSYRGDKIDENANAFNFRITKNNVVKTRLESAIKGHFGTIQIKLLNNKKLEWLVIREPKGEFYAPQKAILHRCQVG